MAKSVIKYYCKHCGAGFAHLNNLSKHLLTHKDTTSQMDHYTCFICDAIFAEWVLAVGVLFDHSCGTYLPNYYLCSDQDLIEHKKIHQRPSPIKEVPSPSSDIPLTAVNETKTKKKMKRKHYCQYCSWAFCSQSLLAAHVRVISLYIHHYLNRWNEIVTINCVFFSFVYKDPHRRKAISLYCLYKILQNPGCTRFASAKTYRWKAFSLQCL